MLVEVRQRFRACQARRVVAGIQFERLGVMARRRGKVLRLGVRGSQIEMGVGRARMRPRQLFQHRYRLFLAVVRGQRSAHQHGDLQAVRIDFASPLQQIERGGRAALQHPHARHSVQSLRRARLQAHGGFGPRLGLGCVAALQQGERAGELRVERIGFESGRRLQMQRRLARLAELRQRQPEIEARLPERAIEFDRPSERLDRAFGQALGRVGPAQGIVDLRRAVRRERPLESGRRFAERLGQGRSAPRQQVPGGVGGSPAQGRRRQAEHGARNQFTRAPPGGRRSGPPGPVRSGSSSQAGSGVPCSGC